MLPATPEQVCLYKIVISEARVLASMSARCRVYLLSSLYCILFIVSRWHYW